MEELTESEQNELFQDLQSLKKELESFLSNKSDKKETVDLDLPIGRLTRMDAIQQQKMDEAGKRQAELRLSQVKISLKSFNDDEYGFCRKCEEPIGYKRLKAKAEAPFCMNCQNAVERRR